jgi:hypothetical protein
MKPRWTIIALLGIMMVIAAPVAGQPASFLIDGYVSCTNGDPVNDPIVAVANLNTSEVFIAETNVGSYRIITSSFNASAGNVLCFNVSDNEFDHPVTKESWTQAALSRTSPSIECGPAESAVMSMTMEMLA